MEFIWWRYWMILHVIPMVEVLNGYCIHETKDLLPVWCPSRSEVVFHWKFADFLHYNVATKLFYTAFVFVKILHKGPFLRPVTCATWNFLPIYKTWRDFVKKLRIPGRLVVGCMGSPTWRSLVFMVIADFSTS